MMTNKPFSKWALEKRWRGVGREIKGLGWREKERRKEGGREKERGEAFFKSSSVTMGHGAA